MKHWLQVDLSVPSEFVEPIANFLMEQGADGIEEVDEGRKWRKVKAYFPPRVREKKVLPAIRRYLTSVQRIFPKAFQYRLHRGTLREKDWSKSWRRFFKPVQVTPQIVVKPPWSSVKLKRGQIAIEIIPGLAFGTGTHPTTKLCIQMLERTVRRKGLSVLDVGTGSGILSIVAAKLGARQVCGIDHDELSVEIARENVEKNRVSDIVKIRRGTIGAVRKRSDVIVANIDLKGLRKMRGPLIRHLKNEGLLILSGLLEGEGRTLCRHYLKAESLKWIESARQEEWVCLTFRKKKGD